MTITAISLSIQSSALEFSFISPQEVNAESEFQVVIDAEAAEDYDVKIYVHDDIRQYSEIFNGEKWVSPFNYIPSSLPAVSTYRILPHYIGDTEICIKLRRSSDKNDVSSVCNQISVLEESNESSRQPPISRNEEESETVDPGGHTEKIILNSPDLEQTPEQAVTSVQRFRVGIIYAFSFFCIVIIVLLALKAL